jgi:hypothetical protein
MRYLADFLQAERIGITEKGAVALLILNQWRAAPFLMLLRINCRYHAAGILLTGDMPADTSRLAGESCAPDSGLRQQTYTCPNPCASTSMPDAGLCNAQLDPLGATLSIRLSYLVVSAKRAWELTLRPSPCRPERSSGGCEPTHQRRLLRMPPRRQERRR